VFGRRTLAAVAVLLLAVCLPQAVARGATPPPGGGRSLVIHSNRLATITATATASPTGSPAATTTGTVLPTATATLTGEQATATATAQAGATHTAQASATAAAATATAAATPNPATLPCLSVAGSSCPLAVTVTVTVTVSAASTLTVSGSHWPTAQDGSAASPVRVFLVPDPQPCGSSPADAAQAQTDSLGNFTLVLTLPANAKDGALYGVCARTQDGKTAFPAGTLPVVSLLHIRVARELGVAPLDLFSTLALALAAIAALLYVVRPRRVAERAK